MGEKKGLWLAMFNSYLTLFYLLDNSAFFVNDKNSKHGKYQPAKNQLWRHSGMLISYYKCQWMVFVLYRRVFKRVGNFSLRYQNDENSSFAALIQRLRAKMFNMWSCARFIITVFAAFALLYDRSHFVEK